ncbi:MAG: GntR family transcriptional regulator [Sphaerochaeta sp.]|uniref:FadR/GntR family transcriptional regulator n=1 Tax=Sphaerochaeta sp. TaxID=1972642 RepID=UPI0025830BB6|nr:GntR family transcriptional regulator [Sphaerochaeta sp.]MDD4038693.1 GntR family transcriptional regulator [Sphaerochaeta sp.]
MEDIFAVREARPSAVEGVIEKIKALLIEQKLSPGDMIPNEISLAESLKVGRGTVREALKILSAYGVVEIKQGYGTYVSSASNKRLFDPQLFQILVQDRDYKSLTQVRQLLEEGIVKLVIESVSDDELVLLDQTMQKFQTELAKPDASAQHAGSLDLRYHRLLARFSHNSIVENIYNFVIELFTKTINPIHIGVDEVHQRLHQAIMDRNTDKAVEAVREHTAIWISGYEAAHKVV